ncbi:MAG: U32 family peptidase [Oscillospiraceae bacterium]|nr:U32 family peptidase [Oscillospiraceae bacterium]
MTRNQLPEVLSPAGDRERLEAAVRFGADAVYLGGKEFGMRSSPLNFTAEELAAAVGDCHARGVRVYVTCNTVPTNEEMERLPQYLKSLERAGVDALIVADIGVMALCKRISPGLELHISTQAGVANYVTATELFHMGAKRVVLARELSLADIARIRDKTPPKLEIEAFVHGSMCMSFSGRCLLSNYLVGRDANRGECAQPCRWGYHLMEEKRPGQYFPVFEDEGGSYILNAKDLCMLGHVDQLAGAGVDSIKIEGRAKSAYYVAVVTNAYRLAVDEYARDPEHFVLPEWLEDEVRKVSHRRYDTGFYFGRPEDGQCYENGGYIREYDVVAVVDGWEDGTLLCTQRNRFFPGDELEALAPKSGFVTVFPQRILDENGQELDAARHPMQKICLPGLPPFPEGTILRKRQDG